MKIEIKKSTMHTSNDINTFNKEVALALMKYLKIKREPALTLFTEINKVSTGTFRGRRKLLQIVPYSEEREEKNKIIKTNKTRNLFRIYPMDSVEENTVEKSQTIIIEYIRRNGDINIQSINSKECQLKLKLTPTPKSNSHTSTIKERKKKIKNAISYRDRMIINALIEHQNIYLKDYAEVIGILNENTGLHKSLSTNLRKIKSLEEIKKDKRKRFISNKTTEIIINTNNKERFYYLVSNEKKQYLIQEKEASRRLILDGVSDWLLVINKIQMAFTEATGYLNKEYNLSLQKEDTEYREVIINAIQKDNSFLRANKRKWKNSCNIKVLWKNHNSKNVDIIPLDPEVITSRIHSSQEHKDIYNEKQIGENASLHNHYRAAPAINTMNNSLKQKIDGILDNLNNLENN